MAEDKPKMGRPRIEIDWPLVEDLAHIQCTLEEIASVLKVSRDTLMRRCQDEKGCTFATFLKNHAEKGKCSLRRMMWKKAKAGHPTMMIWLSKNYLGMRDSVDVNTPGAKNTLKLAYSLDEPPKQVTGEVVDAECEDSEVTKNE